MLYHCYLNAHYVTLQDVSSNSSLELFLQIQYFKARTSDLQEVMLQQFPKVYFGEAVLPYRVILEKNCWLNKNQK